MDPPVIFLKASRGKVRPDLMACGLSWCGAWWCNKGAGREKETVQALREARESRLRNKATL